jgi:membrane-associated phospholipid phosphatase
MRTALFGAMWLPSAALPAQTIPKDFVFDVKYGVFDVLSVWASPFRGSLRGYAIGALSLGLAGASSIFDDNAAAWIRKHPNAGVLQAVNPVREGSGLSLVNIGAGGWHEKGALAVYGAGLFTRSRAVRDLGMGCLAASQAHLLVRTVVYKAVSRERPLFRETVGGTEIDRPGRPYALSSPGQATWWDNSFFAGHVTTVTSCISFITHRFHLGYAEPALWAFGAALSLGRMADQRHYASDVLIGGLIGFAVGKVVGDRSRDRAEQRDGRKARVPGERDEGTSRSWLDGVYMTQSGSSTLLGWRNGR